jgi:hypothetical protein
MDAYASHSEGWQTTALGTGSHAEGTYTYAWSADLSTGGARGGHAEGYNTTALYDGHA